MAPHDDPEKEATLGKLKRLQMKIAEAEEVTRDANKTHRMVNTKLKQLQSAVTKIKPLEQHQISGINFGEMCSEAIDEAEDLIIELQGFLEEIDAEDERKKLKLEAEVAKEVARSKRAPPTASKHTIKLTIPTFSGECEKYPNFRAAFLTALENEDLTNQAKLRVLEQHVSGRPARLIENIRYSEDGFDQALEILDDTYNVKERQREAIMNKIRKLPKAKEDLYSIRENYEILESSLRALNEYQDIDGEELRRLVMGKFSDLTLDRISSTEVPTLQLIRSRLKTIVRIKEDQAASSDSASATSVSMHEKPLVPIAAFPANADARPGKSGPTSIPASRPSGVPEQANKNSKECKYCLKSGHGSEDCSTYTTAKERLFQLPMGTCSRCLLKSHDAKDCKNAEKCKFCKSTFHHTSLCPKKFGWFSDKAKERADFRASQRQAGKEKEKNEPISTTIALATQTQACYLTAMCLFRNPTTVASFYGRLFQDSGCNLTFILQQVATDLRLRVVDQVQLRVKVFLDAQYHEITSNVVELELIEPGSGNAHRIRAHTVPRITEQLVTLNAKGFKNRFPQLKHLQMVDEGNGEEISLLLGNNFLWSFLLPETKIKIGENLFVISTLFGHMIVGDHQHVLAPNNTTTSLHVSTKPLNSLWSLDAIGITDKSLTSADEEQIALQQFNETIKWHSEEKRYEVGLPCHTIRPEIPTNFGMAVAILRALLRKYQKRPEYLRVCTDIFREQLESGIIELVPETEMHADCHYIPYKWIERPGKSTPIRVVYNASAKPKQQKSLNDVLYKGVNLLADLLGILIRFRLHPVVVIADIAKAFHQITILPEFRNYLRFLWAVEPENAENTKLITYRFRRLPFGVISSPFILAATILHHLDKYPTPTAARIRRDIYADNIITSFRSLSEAKEFYPVSMEMFDEAGLPLRQWQSNVPEMRDMVPVEFRDEKEVTTVLGITWNTKKDMLAITNPDITVEQSEVITMLTVLQQSAKFYDPLGWFTPVTITSRMFLQTLHAKNYDWTTVLDNTEANKWREIRTQHLAITLFQFVRSFTKPGTEIIDLQLHAFSDASDKAYGAAVYLRTDTSHGLSVHLLLAKSRVTPLKSENRLTIPRLELMGAVLASRLLRSASEALRGLVSSQTIWSDSKTILAWLRTNAALPAFVKNRVHEIRATANVKYRYVPSAQNPADLASRGVSVEDLRLPRSIWWHGPEWLQLPRDRWPACDTFVAPPEEIVDPASFVALVPKIEKYEPLLELNINNYNSFTKLIRVTALVIQFFRNFQVVRRKRLFSSRFTSIEIATEKWVHNIQQQAFAEIFQHLKLSKKTSTIKKLRLFTDERGIIRLRGRFQHAELTYDENNPVLLPKATEFRFVRLLLIDFHRQRHHASDVATLAAVRTRYWPLSGRKQLSAVLRDCRPCRRERARPYCQPPDSVLPHNRLDQAVAPFSHVGLDIAGHIWIRDTKKWVLLVTCLVTRAVLLEDLDNLESETITYALQRVEAHTDGFVTYLSDNAPQFHLLCSMIQHRSTTPVRWQFLPAHMPWAGGAYERLIGLMKRSLLASLRDEVTVNALHFRTILQQIAGALNDRPLTFLGEKFDGQPLTPNKLLRRRFAHTLDQPLNVMSETSTASFLRHQLKQTNQIMNKFWCQWSTEYLQFLRERHAALPTQGNALRRPPTIGDVVLVHDEVVGPEYSVSKSTETYVVTINRLFTK